LINSSLEKLRLLDATETGRVKNSDNSDPIQGSGVANYGAYFKESLQLQREKKLMASPFGKKFTCTKISDNLFVNFHLPKCMMTFLVICLNFSISKPVTSTKLQLRTKMSYDLFSSRPPNLSFFTPVFLQSYNYSCTIHLLQRQMTVYNCRNCEPLHVKICPG